MEVAFEAIGLEVPSKIAFNHLAERANNNGETTRLRRPKGVLHGRCWKLGDGLEVWTVLYESESGEVFYADCRPGFRARFYQPISPWALTEYDEDGEAVIHGYRHGSDTEVLFELQNLTELNPLIFQEKTLNIGLCGLAYQAQIIHRTLNPIWRQSDKFQVKRESDWSLCGQILSFRLLRNPLSGNDLYWVYVHLNSLNLEVLINRRGLFGEEIKVGAMLHADVWLQGHILEKNKIAIGYEGVDKTIRKADFWRVLRRSN